MLNKNQQIAVQHDKGPALVLAGAGTGKTRVITERISQLLENGVSPYRIMAVTFTRKAANEMNRRIADAGLNFTNDYQRALPWCGTFHSLAVKFLSQYGERNFSVLDENDSQDLLYRIFKEEELSYKKKDVGNFISLYSYARNTNSDIEDLIKRYGIAASVADVESWFQLYEERKKEAGAKDFDDLLIDWGFAISEQADLGHNFFDYILVDEYQDINYLQETIIEELARMTQNIMVVGDDAQSIYGFRGSSVENILSFGDRYLDCKVIKLQENYRSRQAILDLSNELWKESTIGMQKNLTSSNRENVALPILKECTDENAQARKIVDSVVWSQTNGINLNDQAILFRSAYQAIKLELELRKRRIKYKKYGGRSIADAAHTKDIQSILRAIVSQVDEPAWMRFLMLFPGVGEKTAIRIFNKVKAETDPNIFRSLTSKEKAFLGDFTELFVEDDLFGQSEKADLTTEQSVVMAFEKYLPLLQKNYDKFEDRKKELEVLIEASSDYDDLREFLNAYFLAADDGKEALDNDVLTLSTVHSAKGCEWQKVIVMSLADRAFPSARSCESGELEEERRLMYVAFTRAKEVLELYWPRSTSSMVGGSWEEKINERSRFLTYNVCRFVDEKKATSRKNNYYGGNKKKDLYDFDDVYYDFEDV